MSAVVEDPNEGIVNDLQEFIRVYCQDAVSSVLQGEHRFVVSWCDLDQFDSNLAESVFTDYYDVRHYLTEAVRTYGQIAAQPYADEITVNIVDLPDRQSYTPMELRKVESPGYVAVTGELSKVTLPRERVDRAALEHACGCITEVNATLDGWSLPPDCENCTHSGNWEIDLDESTFLDYAKARVATPPDQSGDLQDQSIDVNLSGELVWRGHDRFGLAARSGDSVTVYGHIRRVEADSDGLTYTRELTADAIEFDTDANNVDVDAHRESFESFAAREDAIETFKQSLVPKLYATPAWDTCLELLTAYLFAAPRIDIDGAPSFRGDIHALIISDYGMGKSMVNEEVAKFSPQCIKESVTGMSSEVGLLAAAVEDDFGDSQWTLEPGILVRGNGGHVILDEIDKTDADLERMNDALEGEQVVDVNKAGQSATYKSRCGLLATGNPTGSRFDPTVAISEQLDIGQSLLSRFDGIVTMRDTPDEDIDKEVGRIQTKGYIEAQERQHGDRDKLDVLDREVTADVGRAWIKYARENIFPTVPESFVDTVAEWYAEEIRQLNDRHGPDADDLPVPATARVVESTLRFAVAFARVRLRDTVHSDDLERAMSLKADLIGQTFEEGQGFQPPEVKDHSQQSRKDTVKAVIRERGPIAEEQVVDVADGQGYDREKIEHDIQKLRQSGDVIQKQGQGLRFV